MPRCSKWEDKLALFVEEKRNQPFDWLTNNCAFFACDWLVLCFDLDPAKEFRNLTARQVVELLRDKPLDTLAEEIAMNIGWYCVAPARAHRGDIVEIAVDGYPALGVCIGSQSVFPGKQGITFVKTLTCRRAWRVE